MNNERAQQRRQEKLEDELFEAESIQRDIESLMDDVAERFRELQERRDAAQTIFDQIEANIEVDEDDDSFYIEDTNEYTEAEKVVNAIDECLWTVGEVFKNQYRAGG